jgi:hypothetical protein
MFPNSRGKQMRAIVAGAVYIQHDNSKKFKLVRPTGKEKPYVYIDPTPEWEHSFHSLTRHHAHLYQIIGQANDRYILKLIKLGDCIVDSPERVELDYEQSKELDSILGI